MHMFLQPNYHSLCLSTVYIAITSISNSIILFFQTKKVKMWLDGKIENGFISSGYLIISYGNIKGYVCAESWMWNIRNMRVACGQLGFPEAVKLRAMKSDWPFILTGLDCKGTESSLLSCKHTGFAYEKQKCKSNTAVWLQCKMFNRTAKFKNVSKLRS